MIGKKDVANGETDAALIDFAKRVRSVVVLIEWRSKALGRQGTNTRHCGQT